MLEETPEMIYVVLPPGRRVAGELSDRDLDTVAGGRYPTRPE